MWGNNLSNQEDHESTYEDHLDYDDQESQVGGDQEIEYLWR